MTTYSLPGALRDKAAAESAAVADRPLAYELDLSEQLARAWPSMLFEGRDAVELGAWQVRFREKLLDLLWEVPGRGPVDLRFENAEDGGTYVRHRIEYQTEPGVRVPAYLLVPKGATADAQHPGVLCLHGHGSFGKEGVVGIDHTPERRVEIDGCTNAFGRRIAEAGFVVLAPDLRGFGERRIGYPGERIEYCPRNFMVAALLGTTVVAQHVCELRAALDVLQTLPYVAADRLACAGISLGGRITMLLAALDERVQICIPSGCLNLFQERFQAFKQCGAQLIPGLMRYGDTPEIFSLIAPRPMVIEWGLGDPSIPHDWAERGLERIRRAYAAAGVLDRLLVDRFDGKHEFHGTVALDALQRWWASGT